MTTPPAPWPLATFRAFRDRPHLRTALTIGVLVAIGLYGMPTRLEPSPRNILIWDCAALTFIVGMIVMMCDCFIYRIQARAEQQYEVRWGGRGRAGRAAGRAGGAGGRGRGRAE